MRHALAIVTVIFAAFSTNGCLAVASPAVGTIFTNVEFGGDAEGAVGSKEGKACAVSILSMVAVGDASIRAAASAGGIKNVSSVDHQAFSVLGAFGRYCTIVTGS